VCLDEPAAGLDARESEELGQRLRALADAGQSTLLMVAASLGAGPWRAARSASPSGRARPGRDRLRGDGA
jgi:ABC-type cobalamin/Fe3+-siderophores transport system ATPase subunit